MRQPIPWDLYGDRGVNFVAVLPIVGQDFTGATFAAQVRAVADAPGVPIRTLTVALNYGGTDTVANHITAGRIGANIYDYINPATQAKYAPADSIPVSLIQVSAADMSTGIPSGKPTGANVVLAWDMLIDPAGATPQDKWVSGSFIVRGTVTQP